VVQRFRPPARVPEWRKRPAREALSYRITFSKLAVIIACFPRGRHRACTILPLAGFHSGLIRGPGIAPWYGNNYPRHSASTSGLTRTNVGANSVWMTFTPLLGVSTVVKRFLHEKSDDRHKVVMTIDAVEHYSDDDKKTIIASYPAHELEARTSRLASWTCSHECRPDASKCFAT
jgi:phage terminase large subunit-like protein